MESDTFYRDFMVKLIWRLFGSLIYNVFSMKIQDNLRTNFYHEILQSVTLSTASL